MASKENLNNTYLRIATEISKLSVAKRKKVGCVIVKDNTIISFGYNGTPHGFNNICEDENNITVPEVLHAESNAITKVAKSTISIVNSDMYLTLSPCYECAKLIIQSEIKTVYYTEEYRKIDGLKLLEKSNINIVKL